MLPYRQQFKFWLYPIKDKDIIDLIARLKATRGYNFTQAIRDGLRLVGSLRAGQVDVLLELFPWVLHALHAPAARAHLSPVLKPVMLPEPVLEMREAAANSEAGDNFLKSVFAQGASFNGNPTA